MIEYRCLLKSALESVSIILREYETFWQQKQLSGDTVFSLRTALQEAVVNAVRHGNRENPKKYVEIVFRINGAALEIEVNDEGNGFDHQALPDPRQKDQILKLGGKGVFLMRKFMDQVDFIGNGNQVKMLKKITPQEVAKMNDSREVINDLVIYKTAEEINANNCVKLRKAFDQIVGQGYKKVIVDLSLVEYIDSAGLATLIELFQRLQKSQGVLKICGLSDKIKKIFEIAKLDTIFTIYSDQASAKEGF